MVNENKTYLTKEQFIAVTKAWKNSGDHTAGEIIIYNILRGKDAASGFVPKKRKIQGDDEWFGYNLGRVYARARFLSDREDSKKAFEDTFGIERPDDLYEIVKEARK